MSTYQKKAKDLEIWFYRTFRHEAILSYEVLPENRIILPKGEEYIFHESHVERIVDFLLFCEENGVIYGDLKNRNLILYQGRPYMIDFDIIAFPSLSYEVNTQSYVDIGDQRTDPGMRLVWAFGVFLAFNLGATLRYKSPTIGVYTEFLDKLKMDTEHLYRTEMFGKWEDVIRQCLSPNRPNKVRDVQLEVKRTKGEVFYHPSPSPSFNPICEYVIESECPTAKVLLFSFFYKAIDVANLLFRSYHDTFLQSKDKVKTVSFYYACLNVALIPYGTNVGFGTISFHCMIPMDKIEETYSNFVEFLGSRFPSIFRSQ